MRPVTVMLKPSSGACNMRCKYCFYVDETEKRAVANYGFMSPETQEAVIRRVLAFAKGSCTLVFQGGEPTLVGLDFYRRLSELEKQYNVNHVTIHHSIQTNGLLIDAEWAKFFAEHHYLVGVSLDGPKDVHDNYRVDAQGKGTYNRVMHALQILKQHKVDFNILTTLTESGARAARQSYSFFGRNGFFWQQYIPCLDPLGEARGQHPYSLTSKGFENYLKAVFDCWYQDALTGTLRYHRYFYNLLSIMQGQRPEACDMNGVCSWQYVVEADGSVYPCDFYMLDRWRLGNFLTDTFEQIDARRAELRFVEISHEALKGCRDCRWFPLCRGGCRRDREGAIGEPLGENYFCEAYKNFFEYAYPRLEQIIYMLRAGKVRPM